jgi:AcrR family transcriptional regulator
MASKTFLKLNPGKQETIINAAFKEFALKGYDNASLNEIIKQCGVAKGSFYRYFKNKRELYRYLLQTAKEKRLSKLHMLVEDENIGFFKLIRLNFLEKVQFDLENPVVAGFLYKVMHERDNNEISDIIQELYRGIREQTRQIIELPRFKKQLAGFDTTFMAYHVFHLQLWLYEYVADKFMLDYEKNICEGKPVLTIPEKELKATIGQAVEVLKNGIKAKKNDKG